MSWIGNLQLNSSSPNRRVRHALYPVKTRVTLPKIGRFNNSGKRVRRLSRWGPPRRRFALLRVAKQSSDKESAFEKLSHNRTTTDLVLLC